ncbi:hypothetical protein HPB52_016527 [Rhipicephalus sanguineus]|uniref:CCHC-type domain-containing protein n=1 Tax=Rhipicephalus sanguineus TaxID=34632 RepID=A0A9D4PPN3_RHISA|nr:hypothetical protein HPB52_016527 [Rhipicephalus sanguineus]
MPCETIGGVILTKRNDVMGATFTAGIPGPRFSAEGRLEPPVPQRQLSSKYATRPVRRIETTTTRDALRTKEIVVLRRRRRKKAKTLSVRLKQRGSKPPNQRRRRSGNHRPKQAVRRHLRRRQGLATGKARSPAMRRGSGSEDEGVQGNPQVVVAPESQRNERFGELTPERRLEELRAEMEKLSQVISGSARDSELASGRQDRCGELRRYSKRNLSEEALRYVTLQEGRQWVNAPELAASLRTFEEAQGMNSAAKQKVSESQGASVSKLDTQRSSRGGARSPGAETKPKLRGCYACGAAGHQKWNCPMRQQQTPEVSGAKSESLAARVLVGEPGTVPVLCALTDRLTARADCLLSEKAWKSLKEECASERTSKSAEQIDDTQLAPVSGPLPTGKVRKLDVESPVLKAQGEIATMEGVVTQAVARTGDDEGPQGSRASPGETQAAGKKETSASEEVREGEQAGSTLQITGAGQDGIVERHRERSCFVRVPTGPRNLVQVSKLRPRCPRSELKGVFSEEGGAASEVACAPMPATAHSAASSPSYNMSVQVGKRKRSRASEVFGRNGGPLGGGTNGISGRQREDVVRAGFTRKSRYFKGETTGQADQLLKLGECSVTRPSVRDLGRVVGSSCHAPDPEKRAVSKGLSSPAAETEPRDVLGLCGHYLSYGQNYAEVARPPTELTGGRVPNRIPGTAGAEGVSRRHGTALCETASLIRSDLEKPYWLFRNVFAAATEACLSQRAENGAEASVAFERRGFSPTEARETFALSWDPGVQSLALRRIDDRGLWPPPTIIPDANTLSRAPKGRWGYGSGASGADKTRED